MEPETKKRKREKLCDSDVKEIFNIKEKLLKEDKVRTKKKFNDDFLKEFNEYRKRNGLSEIDKKRFSKFLSNIFSWAPKDDTEYENFLNKLFDTILINDDSNLTNTCRSFTDLGEIKNISPQYVKNKRRSIIFHLQKIIKNKIYNDRSNPDEYKDELKSMCEIIKGEKKINDDEKLKKLMEEYKKNIIKNLVEKCKVEKNEEEKKEDDEEKEEDDEEKEEVEEEELEEEKKVEEELEELIKKSPIKTPDDFYKKFGVCNPRSAKKICFKPGPPASDEEFFETLGLDRNSIEGCLFKSFDTPPSDDGKNKNRSKRKRRSKRKSRSKRKRRSKRRSRSKRKRRSKK